MQEVSSKKSAGRWIGIFFLLIVILGIAAYCINTVEARAKNAEMRKIKLPEQSEMILNSGSQAVYTRWTSPRELTLRGEAYFDLSKGATFTVHTSAGTITAESGKFNVRIRGKRLEVSCYEGKINVSSGINNSILIQKNYISFEGREMSWPMPEHRKIPGWMQQQIVFNNETIERICAELQRKYDIKIRLKALKTPRLYSGWLPAKNRKEALQMVCDFYNLELTQNKSGFVLSSRITN